MIVSDNTIEAENLGDFCRIMDKKRPNVPKRMAKNYLKKPRRALDFTANFATAAASKNLKKVMSTLPELITFHSTGKGLYLCKIV